MFWSNLFGSDVLIFCLCSFIFMVFKRHIDTPKVNIIKFFNIETQTDVIHQISSSAPFLSHINEISVQFYKILLLLLLKLCILSFDSVGNITDIYL